MRTVFFSIGLCVSSFFYSCNSKDASTNYIEISGYAQGTTYRVVAHNPENKNLQKSIDSILITFDSVFNNYTPLSIISRINTNDSDVILNSQFRYFFEKSQYFYEITEGAFDITIAPLANAWKFGFHNDSIIPDQEKIDSLLQFIGMEKIQIQNNKIHKQKPQIQIIGNAIAQGYSTDIISEFLLSQNIQDFLVDVGGEMRVQGNNPNGVAWNIGINTPQEHSAHNEYNILIALKNKAIATSGNYRKFYIKDGKKYSHTIHPKTGFPVNNNLLSASIITDICIDADALATACMVMGLEKSIEIINANPQFQAIFMYEEKDSLHTYISPELEQYIVLK